MRVQISRGLAILLLVGAALPVWSQATESSPPGTGGTQPKDSGAAPAATGAIENDDQMVTPPPVSVEGYSLSLGAESERANYLRGGLRFSTTYDDNVLTNSSRATSDMSYSIWPWISLNQSRPRLKWSFSYSPGFTFYQKNTNLNKADHLFETKLEYRLSPNVTLHLRDAYSKSSNFFSQFEQNPGGGTSSVGLQGQNNSVIPPLAERISNAGDVQLTYQISQYGMVGMTGSFSQLRYPDRAQAGGLLDADVKAGELFYTHRVSKRNYLGATYRYQDLLASPSSVETQTHSLVVFYTIYFRPTFSLSAFAGPEYAETQAPHVKVQQDVSPAAGGSFGWQGRYTSLAVSVSRRVTDGGGLGSAVRAEDARASFRRQFTKALNARLDAGYTLNHLLAPTIESGVGGHTLFGGFSVLQSLRPQLELELAYTRLHQSYSNLTNLFNMPDRNRVSISLSYRFERALGR